MTDVDTLYHYCSSEAFASIILTKSIWLSSLNLSNDSMEGKLVRAAIMRLAESDGVDWNAKTQLQESLAFVERFFDGLGFCVSEENDLLSQWRGYADNARGVAIGFHRAYLDELSARSVAAGEDGFFLYKVTYEKAEHEAMLKPTYDELKKTIEAGAYRRKGVRSLLDTRTPEQIADDGRRIEAANRELMLRLTDLVPMLYRLKAHGFREEKEWRLVSLMTNMDDGTCRFRVTNGRIIPYRAFDFLDPGLSPIKEVVVGPRHETPVGVIESMLRQAGFGVVPVRRSEATYRA